MDHGRYVNPGNKGFQHILNSEYIDKTGLIALINERLNSPEGLVCISRPRRFGKSFAAQMLCDKYHQNFDALKTWYDGYEFAGYGSIYNPYSVMRAIRDARCRSFWQKTSSPESLLTYINMDFDGLRESVTRLIAGESIEVDVDGFENNFASFRNKDDILTLLIHLGYLTYHEDNKTVRIPNEEVRQEFNKILKGDGVNSQWILLLRKSQPLLFHLLPFQESSSADSGTGSHPKS